MPLGFQAPVGGDSTLEAFGRRQRLGHLPRRRLEPDSAQLAGGRRGLDRKPGQPVEHRRGEPGERRRAVVAVEESAAVFRIGQAADESPARAPMPRPGRPGGMPVIGDAAAAAVDMRRGLGALDQAALAGRGADDREQRRPREARVR
ncbi:MAG: hypothetical protein ACJ8DS_23730 [Microvirga sp.]